jgi:hypothetical protein
MPDRTQLPDQDSERWPWDSKRNEPKDPWQETHQLVAKRLDCPDNDNGLATWQATGYYAPKQMRKFIECFVKEARKHPGMMPVVTLGSHTEVSPTYGPIQVPLLTIVDWLPFGEGASRPGQRGNIPEDAAAFMLAPPQDNDANDGEIIEHETAEIPTTNRRRDMDDEIPF